MPVKLKIKVTKEILEMSKNCGITESGSKGKGDSCAIALAVRDIFPVAYVCTTYILPNGDVENDFDNSADRIGIPKVATHFIDLFDFADPEDRVKMSPLEFEIEIPDTIIEKINIDELRPLLENHPTLELIN